jgi:hypothetical protein
MKVATALKVRKWHLFQAKDLKQELHLGCTYSTAWIKANKQFIQKLSPPPFDIYISIYLSIYVGKLYIEEYHRRTAH